VGPRLFAAYGVKVPLRPAKEEAMPADRYTKSVLTVIAIALVALVAQNATRPATAQQQSAMCTVLAPCYVKNDGITPLSVIDARGASGPGNVPIRGISPNSGQMK
jgi:hypothetical protein